MSRSLREFKPLDAFNAQKSTSNFSLSKSKLIPEDDGSLDFYWFDCYEDEYNQPGKVFLFGKVYNPENRNSILVVLLLKTS